jgi:glutamine---fructose-6-phosphate transaminase (isomerizing)
MTRYPPSMDELRAELNDVDPDKSLPGAPDPWAAAPTPEHRPGPPYLMTEMIAAEPALAVRILEHHLPPGGPAAALAGAVRDAAAAAQPILVTGCGTSEHAAQGIAEILRSALRAAGLPATGVSSAQAFELALDPPAAGLVIGVSHEGGTAATIRAVEHAGSAGAATGLVTASLGSPAARAATHVVATRELDRGWCHTVGYVSPLVAGIAVGMHVAGDSWGRALATRTDALRRRLEEGIEAALAGEPEPAAETIARTLATKTTLLTVGSGADRPAARELALKIEEGAWLPTTMRDLETFLHGHLPATGETTGLVLLLSDPEGRDARTERAREALVAAQRVCIAAAAILAADAAGMIPDELTPAGRIVIPEAPDLPGPVASLLGTATPLQLLTERLARARGTNPDLIRREDPRYREAAELSGG